MDHNDLKNFEYVKNFIREGGVFVDVGAHQGDYTNFFLSNTDNTSVIYTIELNPDNFKKLTDRFSKNENVLLFNLAVSDSDGEINFYQGKDSFTFNIIGHDMNYTPNPIAGKIKTSTLDTLLKNEFEINLIKIDVEGAELSVIKGMKEVFKKTHYLLLECHLDEDWSKIFEELDKDFDCYNILKQSQVKKDSSRPYQCFCKKKIYAPTIF